MKIGYLYSIQKQVLVPRFLTQQEVDQYYEQGWVLCKQVYSEADVERTRAIIEQMRADGTWEKAPHYSDTLTTDIYNLVPELATIVFNENYIQAMKDLFGEQVTILPEPGIHRNRYFSWHKDSSFLDALGEDYHWDEDFHATMTVMYLQANSKQYGGGISIVPKTQRDADFYHKVEQMNLAERAVLKAKKTLGVSHFNKMENHPDKVWIPSEKGDVIVIDLRLDHKGSDITDTKNRPYDKYGIMNIACKQPHHADKLRLSLKERPSGYYSKYLKFADELSPKVAEIAEKNGVRFII